MVILNCVLLFIQLPNSTCTLNYTLLIGDGHGKVAKRFGPFSHPGSANTKQDIDISDLKRNQVYSLEARADLYSQSTSSNKLYFSKALYTSNAIYIVLCRQPLAPVTCSKVIQYTIIGDWRWLIIL